MESAQENFAFCQGGSREVHTQSEAVSHKMKSDVLRKSLGSTLNTHEAPNPHGRRPLAWAHLGIWV